MTWGPTLGAGLALLVGWLLYAALRRARRREEAPRRSTRSRIEPSYTEDELAERAEAERLMREQDERERRGY